ncbi:MAG: endolytic transglycosylase MltG [Deltaproteobacteria bacterium]|nr:endolytic transglycosylase MltG [Deltaproteobacteria bacterium]
MKKTKIILMISAFLFILFATVEIILFLTQPPSSQKVEVIVTIPKGATFHTIAKELKEKGVITNRFKFYILARLKKQSRKIKAGEYLLYTDMTPLFLLDTLVSGRTYLYRVTLPEGFNMYQVADLYAAIGLIPREEFLVRCTDAVFLESLHIPALSCEGYLFPESYYFSKPVSAETILRTMVKRFEENFSDELSYQAKEKGFTRHQLVTLASMIEKETSVTDERSLISAVFHNRLKINMKLQSDPTVIYGLMDFDGNLKKKDLLTPTPYNTYTRKGLPEGPISNPGRASLEAAVNPANVPYLYFVSRNNGTHYFSSTYPEHLKAVHEFQKKRIPNQPQSH